MLPVFDRQSALGGDRVSFEARDLIMAGWTERDRAAVEHHVAEIRVPGGATPSEVEVVLVALAEGLWVGLGSDHTDRAMKAHGVALSKQLCRKPMAAGIWRFEEIVDHWDRLMLRAHIVEAGERKIYMESPSPRSAAPRT